MFERRNRPDEPPILGAFQCLEVPEDEERAEVDEGQAWNMRLEYHCTRYGLALTAVRGSGETKRDCSNLQQLSPPMGYKRSADGPGVGANSA